MWQIYKYWRKEFDDIITDMTDMYMPISRTTNEHLHTVRVNQHQNIEMKYCKIIYVPEDRIGEQKFLDNIFSLCARSSFLAAHRPFTISLFPDLRVRVYL